MEQRARPQERPHPGPAQYVAVAAFLAIITVVEVTVYYIAALRGVLVPILIVLSAVKFSLVAMFFMHLRYDSRLYSALFSGPLALAGIVILALMALFRILFG